MTNSNKQQDSSKISIFVAATPAEWLPARVLEYSIREQTDFLVEVQYLYQSGIDVPVPDELDNKPRTPFSFQRFVIPELCSYSGRAIYLDADMQVFQDIAQLWDQPFDGCDLQTVEEIGDKRPGQFSVMLLDCARLNWDIKNIVDQLNSGELDYAGLMFEMKVASQIGRNIASSWNCLETFDSKSTKLLHYTDMNTQPWISLDNPLGYLWIACLRRAISSGFITKDEVEREIKASHVRPSLIVQLGTEIDDTIALPRVIRKLDKGFSAPYKKLNSNKKSIFRLILRRLRRFYLKASLSRLFG
jgi:hypothetical protein